MVITEAYLVMQNSNSLNTQKDIRFTIELAELKDIDYRSVKERQKIEFIGYEVSNAVLKEKNLHHFIFDSYCRQELERLHSENRPFYFVIRATGVYQEQNALIDWHDEKDPKEARLVIKYIERRKSPLPSPINVETTVENGIVKLSWKNPESADFIGSYVVRNRYHPPKSPFDGGKLYAGKDEYTLDDYGSSRCEAHLPCSRSIRRRPNVRLRSGHPSHPCRDGRRHRRQTTRSAPSRSNRKW